MSKYKGDVVFVDGVHYPSKDGAADLSRPLRWEDGGYRDAEKDEPLHNDVHHQRDAEVGSVLAVAVGGKDVYAPGVNVVTEETDDGLVYYLVDETDQPQRDYPLTWDSEAQLFRAKKKGGA